MSVGLRKLVIGRLLGALVMASLLALTPGCEKKTDHKASIDRSVMLDWMLPWRRDTATSTDRSPASVVVPSDERDEAARKYAEEVKQAERMAREQQELETRKLEQQRAEEARRYQGLGGGAASAPNQHQHEGSPVAVGPASAPAGGASTGAATGRTDPETAALEEYSVQVSATESMKLNREPGQLSIWIGRHGQAPAAEVGMATAESTLGHGNTALVTPFAPDFTIEPSTSKCQLLDPSGTQVLYSLKPRARGQYKVGANVSLFASSDCSGPPVPKATKVIHVSVSVGLMDGVEDGALELARATWEKILAFWGELLTAVSVTVLYAFRKKLARWFGASAEAR
jgi:hypothetical protein